MDDIVATIDNEWERVAAGATNIVLARLGIAYQSFGVSTGHANPLRATSFYRAQRPTILAVSTLDETAADAALEDAEETAPDILAPQADEADMAQAELAFLEKLQ